MEYRQIFPTEYRQIPNFPFCFKVNMADHLSQSEVERLTTLSQQGDRAAFAKLFELRRAKLSEEVRRRIGMNLQRRVDASDVMQEVFLDANRRLDELANCDLPLMAWLRILLKQKLIDAQRKHIGAAKRSVQRERSISSPFSDIASIAEQLIAEISSPSMKVNRIDVRHKVQRILTELSPLDREVLKLRHFDGLTNAKVADRLGLSINAASNRYIRALKRFRTLLNVDDEHNGDVKP